MLFIAWIVLFVGIPILAFTVKFCQDFVPKDKKSKSTEEEKKSTFFSSSWHD